MSDWNWHSDWPAPAKLNLFLHVVGRRADGYHLLQTVFRFIDRADTLRFEPRDDGRIVLATPIPGVPADSDLTVRAARLPGWLLGRPGAGARIEADPWGRPGKLHEAGWQVDYFYEDTRPAALPSRLTISRPGEIELKLRIEEWRETP